MADEYVEQEPWINARLARCIVLAWVGAGLLSGALWVCMEFWQIGPKKFASENWIDENPPEPALQTIALVWCETQIEYTIMSAMLALFYGWPIFLYCRYRCLREATQRELVISVLACALILGFWIFISEHRSELSHRNSKFAISNGLLMALTFTSSGSWIAWQAWRSVHVEERFLPRFSLGTLMLIVIGLGALMAVFAPR